MLEGWGKILLGILALIVIAIFIIINFISLFH
jgi:uncharacterized integral membrane protein